MASNHGEVAPETGCRSRIYVRQEAYDYGDFDLVEAVDAFVDKMTQWLYRPEELPREAIYSQATHYFVAMDGGSNYVMNGRWKLDQTAAVRAGFRAMGALDYLEYFEWLSAQVDAMKPDIDHLFSEGGRWDKAIRDALNHRTRDLYKLKKAQPFVPLLADYLKGLPNLQPLDDMAYRQAMYELAESAPDYEQRLQEHLFDKNWLTQMIHILCLKSKQRLHECAAPKVIDWEGKISAFPVMLTRGEHRIIQYPNRCELRDDSDKLVAVVYKDEIRPENCSLN